MDEDGNFTFTKPEPKEQEGGEEQEEIELDPYAGTNIDRSQLGQMMEEGTKPTMEDAGKPAKVKSNRNKPSMETGPDKRFSGLPREAGNQNVDSRTERRVG